MTSRNYALDRFIKSQQEFGKIMTRRDIQNFVVSQIIRNINRPDTRLGENTQKSVTKQNHLLFFRFSGSYRKSVSNTHSCPFTGVTNWRGDPSKPRGYPGFQGRVWIITSRSQDTFSVSAFSDTGVYSGTGGYGTYSSCVNAVSREAAEATGIDDADGLLRPFFDYQFIKKHIANVQNQSGMKTPTINITPDQGRLKRVLSVSTEKMFNDIYPLSYDSKLYLDDFEDVFSKELTVTSLENESPTLAPLEIIYTSDKFKKITELAKSAITSGKRDSTLNRCNWDDL